MSDNQAILIYNFKLRPGASALVKLNAEWNCCRWVWNQCVEAGNIANKARIDGAVHVAPTWCSMSKNLTEWRSGMQWLRDCSRDPQGQVIRKWSTAYSQAFKQKDRGFPNFKSSKIALPSIEYTERGFRIKDRILCLAGGISIPVVWSRGLPSEPKSCIVTMDAIGHWNVSFVVRRNTERFPPSKEAIGIDWGVKAVATTTASEFNLPCGNQTKINAQALKDAQRKLARAKPGSRGRSICKLRVARIHLKIARQRKDRAFKWARRIVTNFGKIAVEDFKPKFLSKSTMAKKATDGAIGMTKQILIQMARTAKRECVLVDPAYTTMTCASCGTRNKSRLALQERTFVCESCGHTADRDENAARVIRARAGFYPTNDDDIRPLHGFGCAMAI